MSDNWPVKMFPFALYGKFSPNSENWIWIIENQLGPGNEQCECSNFNNKHNEGICDKLNLLLMPVIDAEGYSSDGSHLSSSLFILLDLGGY